jgi:hypothetical protein
VWRSVAVGGIHVALNELGLLISDEAARQPVVGNSGFSGARHEEKVLPTRVIVVLYLAPNEGNEVHGLTGITVTRRRNGSVVASSASPRQAVGSSASGWGPLWSRVAI